MTLPMRYPVLGLSGLLLVLVPWALAHRAADDHAAAQNPPAEIPATKNPAAKGPATKVVAVAHAIVPGFERFFADEKSDAARGGQLLLSELNCTSCHKADGEKAANVPGTSEAYPTKSAPILSDVGGRIKPAFLRKFLANPHAVKPGTTMPDLFAGLTEAERAANVEAITHYVLSLGAREPAQEFPNIGAHLRGEELFHQVGCAVCHGSRKDGAAHLAGSVPLPNFMEKYTLSSLSQFLLDPLHVRPSGRMPGLNLSGGEARDIASYLLKGLPEVASLRYAYYEGNWNKLPDFSKLTPKASGGTTRIDESLKQRGDQFGLRFEGFLRIDRPGEYTFTLTSDDGSKLWIDNRVVVDNDGTHPPTTKQGRAKLAVGWAAVVVEFFEAGGGEELSAFYEGPGLARRPIAEGMSVIKDPPQRESLAIEIKPALVEQGRKLFASVGCASCHQASDGGKQVASQLTAAALSKLDAAKGCLAEAPGKSAPKFHLSPRQRAALSVAIKAQQGGPSAQPSPAEQIAQTMTRFNCYACHKRGEIGGVENARDAMFQTTMKEMGDEGRIPPDLDGVGAKLTKVWLERLFDQGTHDRPYMHTRMPRFGMPNVGRLVALLPQVDKLPPVAKPESDEPLNKLKNGGWEMIGNKGFGCVKCHSFGPYPAEGIQAMDLTLMSQRLNEDWFKRYVRNPQDFRRGTRMPSAWPTTGKKSLLKNILGGDIDTQIHGVWLYLADGKSARTPFGMVTGSQMLTPFNDAIIYRNFIQGAGPRAIGVGYPENRHLAFDANDLRLALIWQGSFINAQRHRNGRGEGFEPPAGNAVVKLPEGVAFARLPSAAAAWPKQPARELGYHFRGYHLTKDQRPTFLYDIGTVRVEDFPNPIATNKAITLGRTLTLKTDEPLGDLYFRAAVGQNITAANDGWYSLGDGLRMRLECGGSKPVLRKAGSQTELLVPIRFENGTVKVVQEFAW